MMTHADNVSEKSQERTPSKAKAGGKRYYFAVLAVVIVTILSSSSQLIHHQQGIFHEYYSSSEAFVPVVTTATNFSATEKQTTEDKIVPKTVIVKRPFQNHHQNETMRRISVMHVGKTGGTTLRRWVLHVGCQSIKKQSTRSECFKQQRQQHRQESHLSKYCKSIQHGKEWIYPNEKAILSGSDFLFTIRNPVARFTSWYYHTTRKKKKGALNNNKENNYKENNFQPGTFKHAYAGICFPSIHSFGEALQQPNPFSSSSSSSSKNSYWLNKNVSFSKKGSKGVISSHCLELLHATFLETTGQQGKLYTHMTFNYRYYYYQAAKLHEKHRQNKTVWAIRTEHFWDDVQTVDRMLGGQGHYFEQYQQQETHGSENQTRESLTGIHMERVCCALWPDMVAYRKIVDRAANLNATEKLATYQLTWKDCGGVSSWEMLYQKCRAQNLSIPIF